MNIQPSRLFAEISVSSSDRPPLALVLGTGDIASAIGRTLFRAGWGVVQLSDEGVPVLRRGMAFDDALDDGVAELDGVWAVRTLTAKALPALASSREAVVLARLDLAVVLAAAPDVASVLIDARMRKYAKPADLRPLAPCTIGVGPGFVACGNVDIAIETLPGLEGHLVAHGGTATPTGVAVPLAGAGAERFVYAPVAGPWAPCLPLGHRVYAGTVLGTLADRPVRAPIDGCLRGMVRATPTGVARGSKLVEIDPRPDAPWTGVPPRAQRIASGILAALPVSSQQSLPQLTLSQLALVQREGSLPGMPEPLRRKLHLTDA